MMTVCIERSKAKRVRADAIHMGVRARLYTIPRGNSTLPDGRNLPAGACCQNGPIDLGQGRTRMPLSACTRLAKGGFDATQDRRDARMADHR